MWKLEKVSDDKFEGNHPNGFNEGIILMGYPAYMPVEGIGLRFQYGPHLSKLMSTSTITEVILDEEDFTFKTLNSTYKLTDLSK